MKLTQKINALRVALNLTERELAIRLEVRPQVLRQIRNQERVTVPFKLIDTVDQIIEDLRKLPTTRSPDLFFPSPSKLRPNLNFIAMHAYTKNAWEWSAFEYEPTFNGAGLWVSDEGHQVNISNMLEMPYYEGTARFSLYKKEGDHWSPFSSPAEHLALLNLPQPAQTPIQSTYPSIKKPSEGRLIKRGPADPNQIGKPIGQPVGAEE